jgi:urease accessory protein
MILLADRGTTMRTGLITAALTLIPAAAFAHTGAEEPYGFVSGFAHPLGGLDHLRAMLTVGIFAWQLGGRALWLVPGSFVLAMAAGAALGSAGVALPFVELGIAASVIVLGGIVAFACNAPILIAMGVVALFAIFHGHAHGSEMALEAAGAAYAAGFVLATALLHAGGITLGCAIGRVADGRAGYQLGGSFIALAGVAILATSI